MDDLHCCNHGWEGPDGEPMECPTCKIARLTAEIERLQAIVDRLPKDELGDPIVPNDTVFWIGEDGFSHKWTPYIATDGRTWYRTRAAAEKARQA